MADLQETEDLRRTDVQTLLEQNKKPLWNVYKAYCPASHEFGQKKSLPFDCLLKFLKDFNVVPHVINPLTLSKLYKLSVAASPDGGVNLSFEAFKCCLVRVALRKQVGNVADNMGDGGAGITAPEPIKEDGSPVSTCSPLSQEPANVRSTTMC